MARAMLEDAGLTTRLLVALMVIVFSFLLFSLLGSMLALVIFNVDPASVIQGNWDFSDRGTINMLTFLQTIQAVGLFIVPSLLAAWLFSSRPLRFLGFQRSPLAVTLLVGSLVLVAALPFINVLADWNNNISFPEPLKGVEHWMRMKEDQATALTEAFIKMDGPEDFWVTLLVVAVLPGIGEELLFRGVIQRMLTEWFRNVHLAIIVSAVLFSSMHFQFFGFIPRTLMGIWFGYLLVWSRSMWLPVTAHFINNGLAVVYYYLSGKGIIGPGLEHIGTEPDKVYLWILSALVAGLMIWMVFVIEKKRPEHKLC